MRLTDHNQPNDPTAPSGSGAAAGGLAQALRAARLRLALLGVILLLLAWQLAPLLSWAYDVQRAGALLEAGMAWPAPQLAASLPVSRDRVALEQAQVYLAAAIAQRPRHAHAYRLRGQLYAAVGDWGRAAADYEQAIALAPANPLLRWEASLVYLQMQQLVDRAARVPLTETFAAGTLRAPGELVKSLFCDDGGAESCYSGRAVYRQPYAADPAGRAHELPVLFLHPPASLAQTIMVPAEQAGLHFVVGLDPVARGWSTDGALFRVWVESGNRQPELAGELVLDRATALRGWVVGWADLSRWAGQPVTLVLESGAGAAGDRTGDWYGWGDLAFTSVDAARYATAMPRLHAGQLQRGIQ